AGRSQGFPELKSHMPATSQPLTTALTAWLELPRSSWPWPKGRWQTPEMVSRWRRSLRYGDRCTKRSTSVKTACATAVLPTVLPPPFSSIIFDHVYVPASEMPSDTRLFTVNCAELYQMRPSLRSSMVMPANSGNGRLSSYRDSVGLVKRVVPSKPGTWKNGFGSSSLQNAGFP